jgi:hypothetical protein
MIGKIILLLYYDDMNFELFYIIDFRFGLQSQELLHVDDMNDLIYIIFSWDELHCVMCLKKCVSWPCLVSMLHVHFMIL